jgi:hypothetical protein
MAKEKEKTYTLTQSDVEKFARLHKAFCLQHTNGGRLDQVHDKNDRCGGLLDGDPT